MIADPVEPSIYRFTTTPGIGGIVQQVHGPVPLRLDTRLMLHRDLFPSVLEGKKVTTVRYGGQQIRVPVHKDLPFVLTRKDNLTYEREYGIVRIPTFVVKRFAQLNDYDARRDGYDVADELKDVIRRIYEPISGPVNDDAWVSIYDITLL